MCRTQVLFAWRFDYQFHNVLAHGEAMSLVQGPALIGGPENYRMHVATLAKL